MSTRVYVPSSFAGLRDLVAADGIGPPPFLAHAVTDALRAAWSDGSEEDWEYAASTAASRSSLALIDDADDLKGILGLRLGSKTLPNRFLGC